MISTSSVHVLALERRENNNSNRHKQTQAKTVLNLTQQRANSWRGHKTPPYKVRNFDL